MFVGRKDFSGMIFFLFAIEALLWYGFLRSSGGGERAQGVN